MVVFREEDGVRRYLVVRSTLTRRPIWEFPKGGIEEGESEEQAALREMEEEVGLGAAEVRVRPGFREEEHYVFTHRGPGRALVSKQVVYFLAEARTDRVVLSHEADRYVWATAEETHRLIRFPGKRAVLAAAEAYLGGGELSLFGE